MERRKIRRYSWFLCVGWGRTKREIKKLRAEAFTELQDLLDDDELIFHEEELPDNTKCVYVGPILGEQDRAFALELKVRKIFPAAYSFMREMVV